MFVIFEDAKKIHAARVLSQTDASLQAELDTGKRVKVKQAHVLLSFEQPSAAEVLQAAQALSTSIDVQLLWEFAPDGEFTFQHLAQEYFQDPATLEQQAATFLALFAAPHYFRRAGTGKGNFKKAPQAEVEKALAAIEKKAQLQAQIDAWAHDLTHATCPEPIQQQLYKILFKPDKNTPEYKAVAQAAQTSGQSQLDVLQRAGAIASAYELHWQRFLFECFPKGTDFAGLDTADITTALDDLPVAAVQAFSIDDAETTEIDDALSVTGLGSEKITLGIHIAAPALAMQTGNAIDACARARLSTVYMPGYKITMLPDAVVEQYTLQANVARPCVSLYCSFDADTLALLETQSRIEQINVAHNLRTNTLEDYVTADWLAQDSTAASADIPKALASHHAELAFLWKLAQHHKTQREAVRGKPEIFTRPDFKFTLERSGDKHTPPTGAETVHISPRMRGTPLDLIVSEAMIMANHEWAKLLSGGGVAAIYRSQAALQAGIKVRMSTQAQLHAGIGVSCYAWCTSPLRRYVDLVNQWQLIACIQHGATAALRAPFKPKDTDLLALIAEFDASYASYKQFQRNMELYWTLQYIQRQHMHELEATIIRDGKEALARADKLPLVLPVVGAENIPLKARVRLRLGDIDCMQLAVSASFVARLDAVVDDADTDAEIDVETHAETDAEFDADTSANAALADDAAPNGAPNDASNSATNSAENPNG